VRTRRATSSRAPSERGRLGEDARSAHVWRRWGPYLAERQWGTVREDYSADGNAWNHFPHDMASWRSYRWDEDGIAGLSDNRQRLCLALALWNGRDPILKERLFGLANEEGNHGEDVKELYWYLDATPTHSYLKFLYKYPQSAFPYSLLREESRRRGRGDPAFGLLDTGLFDEDRYFDILVEYAKATPDDLLMRVTVTNRGPDPAALHLLPQLWFRNTWSWKAPPSERPSLRMVRSGIEAQHVKLGTFRLDAADTPQLLFCENDSNPVRLGGAPRVGYFKDAFHDYVVHERREAVNPAQTGTKAAALYRRELPAGDETCLRLRLARHPSERPFADFDAIVATRREEADRFYDEIQFGLADPEARSIHRQALAGMIWNKQYYRYDVPRWLAGDPTQPPPPEARRHGRNAEWEHVDAGEILSMPDKWEYPWFAAWDTAFHCLPLVLVDPGFAKEQLVILTREWYLHPSGQIPAYEWDFGNANPPVHAWAAWQVFRIDRERTGGAGDLAFLERVFHKLMLNFTWWVNRKDAEGRNMFQGGFLGLDNIGVFERSKPLPGGGRIDQADGTAWMAMYALNLMRIALELAQHNAVYEDIASKFFEHFLRIAEAMRSMGPNGVGLWDDADGFFYDVLRLPDGRAHQMKVRSVVGLVPLFAVEVLEPELLVRCRGFEERLRWLLDHRPALAQLVSRWQEPGAGERRLLSLLRGHRMKLLLARKRNGHERFNELAESAMLPPILEFYVVWHPQDSAGAMVAAELLDHFHGTAFTGLIGGAVELFVRYAGWRAADDAPRPIPVSAAAVAGGVREAEFVAIVPLVGNELASAVETGGGPWHDYVQGIVDLQKALPKRVAIFPYALDAHAMEGTQIGALLRTPLRIAAGGPCDADTLEGMRCRDLAQGVAQFMAAESMKRITVFLSHTKKALCGEEEGTTALIQSMREVISQTRLREFFDASDLQPGEDWDKDLRQNAASSALLAIRTDLYPTREWCQREMLIAKNAGMPVVTVDALGKAEERGSFIMDHIPRAPVRQIKGKWSKADLYVSLNLLVDQCLKRVLWLHQERLSKGRSDIAWWAPHAPEPLTLMHWLLDQPEAVTSAGKTIRILHPDPPLGPDERLVLDQILALRGGGQELDIMTPRLLAARGG
jgi:hypothetical protein